MFPPRAPAQPLGADLVAVPAYDPVPIRDLLVVYRRRLQDSPALVAVIGALRSAGVPA
jgi:hypothetical protein